MKLKLMSLLNGITKINKHNKMSEAKKYLKKKRWKTIPKKRKKHFIFDSKPSLNFIAIDPNTYKIVRIFKGVYELEFATNRKNLQPLLYKYTRNQLGKRGSPLLCGWIIVQLDDSEIGGKSQEQLQKIVQRKAIDKIIMLQMQRIRENLTSFTQKEKELIFKFLSNAESPNTNNINIKIEL